MDETLVTNECHQVHDVTPEASVKYEIDDRIADVVYVIQKTNFKSNKIKLTDTKRYIAKQVESCDEREHFNCRQMLRVLTCHTQSCPLHAVTTDAHDNQSEQDYNQCNCQNCSEEKDTERIYRCKVSHQDNCSYVCNHPDNHFADVLLAHDLELKRVENRTEPVNCHTKQKTIVAVERSWCCDYRNKFI